MTRRTLLPAAALCFALLLASCGGTTDVEKSPESPSPTPAATPRAEVVVTAQPGSTPSPVETPAPVEIPSDEPTGGSGLVDVSGSIRSETGTALNLIADWECVSVSARNVRLTVTLYLESYSLSVGERYGNTLRIGEETVTFRTPALEVPSGELVKTELYSWSETYTLPEDGQLTTTLSAAWAFAGSYSGVELPEISLSGQVSTH